MTIYIYGVNHIYIYIHTNVYVYIVGAVAIDYLIQQAFCPAALLMSGHTVLAATLY